MLGEKRLCASSKAKHTPVSGALNAAASPALEPPVIKNLRSLYVSPAALPMPSPSSPPTPTDGPSLPSGMPQAKEIILPTVSAAAVLSHFTRSMPRAAPSASGMPLPFADGQSVCTIAAAKQQSSASVTMHTAVSTSLRSAYRAKIKLITTFAQVKKSATNAPAEIPVIRQAATSRGMRLSLAFIIIYVRCAPSS